MGDHYEEAFATVDDQNITYIQYIHQNEGEQINFQIIPSHTESLFKQEDDDELCEETLCEELIETEDSNTVEVLESVVVGGGGGRKSETMKSESVISKKLIQITESSKAQKGRKRAVSDQTRAIRKMRANTNKAYVNAKGKEVTPKEFDAKFICTCPKRCTEKLSVKTRRQIFNMFWSIGSYEGRCAFLNSCVNEVPKKKQYTKSENSRRKNTRRYYLKGVEVCKLTFVKTLQISNSRIDVSLQKMENENFSDERGKKRSGHGFGEETKEAVIAHIKNNFTADSSLRGLWNFYQTTHPESPVSESYYKRIFYENFNLKTRKKSKATVDTSESED